MRGHLARRLCWLGQDLCDYNAPLLARDFSERTTPEDFLAAWHELQVQMQCEPLLRHDWIEFEKMPETVGAQTNPFMHLDVTPNRSSAHLARLGERLGKILLRQALVGDAPARPLQAPAYVAIRRHSLHDRGRCRRTRAARSKY